ncbi:M60 family metallopeptidase [Verrucomicrobiales bacterium]|nr:M60 family metallopeptidase [Verrucomicrobiales bacterium]
MKYLLPLLLLFVTPLKGQSFETLLNQLSDHLSGRTDLSTEEIPSLETGIIKEGSILARDTALIAKAFEVIAAYDDKHKPLFLNQKTKGGFSRKDREGKELEHAILQLHQALLDYAYRFENIQEHTEIFAGKAFGTADFFPGKTDPPTDPRKTYTIKIDTSQLPSDGYPQTTADAPARRCTGWYVAPGTIAELKVPANIVKKGYNIRVGAHSWDLAKKPVIKRPDRISIVYPILDERMLITNPMGGGIYLEVPPNSTNGIQEFHARNIVEAPFYSARAFDKTSLEEWLKNERTKPAPWADFESEKFMMQVPTAWVSKFKTPDKLTADYDKCMDLVSEITGRPKIRSKVVLYQQIDVILRGGAFFPGYPQSNYAWDPLKEQDRKNLHWFMRGPQFANSELFHEMGHHERITKFAGETEALVNFLYVYVHNQGFDVDLDTAFSRSMGSNRDKLTIERAAIDRMITETFRKGQARNTTNRPGDEVKYQQRGYGHYADIAKLFGWEPLLRFAAEDQELYRKGKDFPKNINRALTDNRILRYSIATGADLRPLFEFWGIYPDDEPALAKAIKKENLKPSAIVLERLKHYQTLVPANQSDFKKHALIMYPQCESPGKTLMQRNPLFGHGFYHKWLTIYNQSHGEEAATALQTIIKKHFTNEA